MRKKFVAIFLDIALILIIGVIFLILSTGGFSVSLGPLLISAHSLENPTIVLIIILFLRKIVLGKFFGEFICFRSFRRRLVESQRLRKLALIAPLFLFLMLGLISVVNPLQKGVIGNYYENTEWAGSPIITAREIIFDLWRATLKRSPLKEQYSIQWTGAIFIPQADDYEFITVSSDGSELHIDNRLVIDNTGSQGIHEEVGHIDLEKGFHTITVRYAQKTETAYLKVDWKEPEKEREDLSLAPLFTEKPTNIEIFLGRGLEMLFIICTFLLLTSILIAWLNRRLLVPVLKTSLIGTAYSKCCSWFSKEDIAKQAFPSSARKSSITFLLALAAYTVLSLVWTYPLVVNFSTNMFGLGGDRYIYLWNMWWLKKALLDLQINPLYTDYIFYPKGISLAFHDFSLLLTTISLPLQGIFSLQEIYNMFFLLSFILGSGGCFLLVRYLTGDNLAAFLAGIVFAFWGGRAYSVDHFYLASIQWIPYCVFYLLKTFREPSYRNPLLAAIFLVLNALTSWVYAIYMVIFIALFLLYVIWTKRKTFLTAVAIHIPLFFKGRLGGILLPSGQNPPHPPFIKGGRGNNCLPIACMKRFGLIGILFTILMCPVVYPMVMQILEGEQYMNAPVLPGLSASLNMLFLPNPSHGILGEYVTYLYLRAGLPILRGLTGGLFLGYLVIFLCVYAGFKLKHLQTKFWTLAGVCFLLLALGPHLHIFSERYTWIPLPYKFLAHIPILKTVRVPQRFMMMVMLCCSVLVGYACWDIFRRIRFRKTMFVFLMGVMLFEFFRFYYVTPLEQPPDFYKELGQDSEPYAILELTRLTELEHAARRSSLFQITHGKKLFNGFVARVSPETYNEAYRLYRVFDDLLIQPRQYLDQPDPSVLKIDKNTLLAVLSYYNVRYVVLYPDYQHGTFQENIRRLSNFFGQPIAKERGMYLFQVNSVPILETLVFPGHGMFPLQINADGTMLRQASIDGDIRVLNVNEYEKLQLRFQGRSNSLPEDIRVQIFVNEELATTISIGDWTDVTTPPVAIKPGENTIRFRMPDITDWTVGVQMRNISVDLL